MSARGRPRRSQPTTQQALASTRRAFHEHATLFKRPNVACPLAGRPHQSQPTTQQALASTRRAFHEHATLFKHPNVACPLADAPVRVSQQHSRRSQAPEGHFTSTPRFSNAQTWRVRSRTPPSESAAHPAGATLERSTHTFYHVDQRLAGKRL